MTRRLLSSHRLVLTGTPIENSLHELWSHVVFLNPGFSTLYRRLTSRIPGFSKSPQAAKLSGALLKPLILRRTKDEVEKDLPPRYEEIVFCDLSNSEKTLYENIRAGFIHMFSSGVTARVASIALEGLLRLRQTCSLPAMLPHSLNPHRVTRCSKLALTQKLLLDHAPMGKTIVFCQFTSVLDALQRHLCDKGVVYERLDGATRDRSERIKRFQQNPLVRVFLISFRAGGVGINLTAADRVILYEPWWNPAAEEQSFARAHRIGQTKSVLVQRLICRDTVEEKILALREKKKTLALDTYSSSQQLSVDELKEMLT